MKEEVDWSKNIQAILAENCIFFLRKNSTQAQPWRMFLTNPKISDKYQKYK